MLVREELLYVLVASYHLKEGEVTAKDVVKVDLCYLPRVVKIDTICEVVDDRNGQQLVILVNAFRERAFEELHAHDTKDKPEDYTHHYHVEDSWNGVSDSIHHNLGQQKKSN